MGSHTKSEAGLYGASLQFTPAALLYRWTSLYQYAGTHVTILLSILIVAAAQELNQELNRTSHAIAAENQSPPPPAYKVGTYSTLSEELAAHQHSRFTVQLKPGHDLLDIILTLFDWKEQDTDQLWIRPVEHVDRDKYDTGTPSGMEAALMTFMRKASLSTNNEAILQFTDPTHPAGQQTKKAVLDTIHKLRDSGQITTHNGLNSISWKVPGGYKMDLKGDVNVLRKALLVALQQSPGIEYAHMDDHFIQEHRPAWYEVSAEPWDVDAFTYG